MRVRVDRDLCISAGNCVANAPTVFKLDGEEIAVVLDPAGVTAEEHVLWSVAKDCPTAAIILEDDDGNVLYP
jgi:ferredoxin